MNLPRNGRDWAGLIAFVLTCTLSAILLITVVALLFLDADLSDEGGRLLSGIGLALAGALATFLGTRHRKGGE